MRVPFGRESLPGKGGEFAGDETETDDGAINAADSDIADWLHQQSGKVSFEKFERFFFGLIGALLLLGSVAVVGSGLQAPVAPLAQTEPLPEPLRPPQRDTAKLESAKPQDSTPAPQTAATPARAEDQIAHVVAAATMTGNPAAPAARDSAREMLSALAPPAKEAPAAPPSKQEVAAKEEPSAQNDDSPLSYASESADAEKAAKEKRRAGEAADDEGGGRRTSRCFVKVSGRVLSGGNCRISRSGGTVTLHYGGGSVTISPHRGREFMLSGAGSTKVYRVGGCWGNRNHTWVCEHGV